MDVRTKLFVCVSSVLSVVCSSQAATIIVDTNGSADYTTIQSAIDNSSNNDEIIVRQGTYYETINTNGKAITLHSTNPRDPSVIVSTIIDANGIGTAITCNSGEDSNTIIEGFIITGGNAAFGGGMYCTNNSNPTVQNCTFAKNQSSDKGGGMYCEFDSSPTLNNCWFTNNLADSGGGIYCSNNSNPTLNNCTITDNEAECENVVCSNTGGGMFCESSTPVLNNCRFTHNGADGGGAAIYSDISSSPELVGTVICGNYDDEISGSFTDNGENIIGTFCPPIPPLGGYPGDLDGDGIVDFVDFAIFADHWLAGVE